MSRVAAARTPASALDPSDLTRTLQAELASPSYRPPVLPAVAMEVMGLAQELEVDLTEVVRVLERDPVLAARVLAISQSARYARRSPVMSLRQAAVRLGLEALTQIVLQAALELRLFRVPRYEPFAERLNRHATAVAHVARAVCRRAGLQADHAFMCGLLHDIGFSATLLVAVEQPGWSHAPFDVLAPVLDAVHADASGLLARTWKLPEPIANAVALHHHAEVDGAPQPVNAAIIVAEQLAWEAGAGILPPPADADASSAESPEQPLEGIDCNSPRTVARACEILRLDARLLTALRGEAFELVLDLDGPHTGARA